MCPLQGKLTVKLTIILAACTLCHAVARANSHTTTTYIYIYKGMGMIVRARILLSLLFFFSCGFCALAIYTRHIHNSIYTKALYTRFSRRAFDNYIYIYAMRCVYRYELWRENDNIAAAMRRFIYRNVTNFV